jgi:putative ABC transport system permease protein
MLSVYRTLSLRYLGRHWLRAVLIVGIIALGVATLVATRALNDTMTRAGLAVVNPIAGVADLVVSNGEFPISRELARELAKIPGIQAVHPRIFENAKLPDHDNRTVLIMGIDVMEELKAEKQGSLEVTLSPGAEKTFAAAHFTYGLTNRPPAIVGKELDRALPKGTWFLKVPNKDPKLGPTVIVHAGTLEGRGTAAALGGNVLIMDLPHAAKVVGIADNHVNRIDLVFKPGSNKEKVRQEADKVLTGRAEVRTPDEQNQAVGNVMSGMQTGFQFCGLAALVVGLFLVAMALAVCVAERRHEIGVLLSLGATRQQIWMLFAGEAAILGLTGSLLGIPLGIGLAYLGLQPVQEILRDIFFNIEANQVEVSTTLLVVALLAGVITAVAAALLPALLASLETPAEAVRRLSKASFGRLRLVFLGSSLTLLVLGGALILFREALPYRLALYGALGCVKLGALLATPLIAPLAAQGLRPFVNLFLGVEWRLAADSIVRSPLRTGLVIAALAAGVGLVMQTAGVIRSNRIALREWVQESIAADLFVSSGSPVGAGQGMVMKESLGKQLGSVPGVEAALPTRVRKILFRQTQIQVFAFEAAETYSMDKKRGSQAANVELYRILANGPVKGDATALLTPVIVSENFSALHGIRVGDTMTLAGNNLAVVGKVVDYSWNHGTIYMNRRDYLRHWPDPGVGSFDIYLQPDADKKTVQETILRKYGAENALVVLSREELQNLIDDVIERLYGLAYSLQLVVMMVAALGVVMALLISVLQRRREMGLLRAIGATRFQVIRSVLAEACLMGVIGTGIGFLVGMGLQWYVLKVLILQESGYLFPIIIPWQAALVIAGAAMATATLAGLGPALSAVRERIPEAIAYE